MSVGLTGTVIRDEVGLALDKVGKEVLGHASKVVLTKDTTTIVGDGSTQEAVNKRVAQIKNLIEVRLLCQSYTYSRLCNVYLCSFCYSFCCMLKLCIMFI